ncbi:unnamed protein product [Polarella glacialis]|uniref:Uncharacterized protein n=1 Tax=Polarella glacialis TaxID=89957 RepID=A0A813HPM7_POLGL|nr:unnamed protein product [Polarella glacialis]
MSDALTGDDQLIFAHGFIAADRLSCFAENCQSYAFIAASRQSWIGENCLVSHFASCNAPLRRQPEPSKKRSNSGDLLRLSVSVTAPCAVLLEPSIKKVIRQTLDMKGNYRPIAMNASDEMTD